MPPIVIYNRKNLTPELTRGEVSWTSEVDEDENGIPNLDISSSNLM